MTGAPWRTLPKTERRRLAVVFGVLTLGHAAAIGALLWFSKQADWRGPLPLFPTLAIGGAQAQLLATAAVLRDVSAERAVGGSLLAWLGLAGVYSVLMILFGEEDSASAWMMLVVSLAWLASQFAVSLAIAWGLRIAGWQWELDQKTSEQPWRFSLAQLLIAMVCAAAVLGVLRPLLQNDDGVVSPTAMFAAAAAMLWLPLVGATLLAAVGRPRGPTLIVALHAVAATLLGILLLHGFDLGQPGCRGQLLYSAAALGAVLASALFLRVNGLRLE